MNNPGAFAETYWSINSLRVYTASGKPATGSTLSKGAIAGIAIGAVIFLALVSFLIIRWRRNRRLFQVYREEYPSGEGGFALAPPSEDEDRKPSTSSSGLGVSVPDWTAVAGRRSGNPSPGSSTANLQPDLSYQPQQPKLTKDKRGKVQVVRARGLREFISGSRTPDGVGESGGPVGTGRNKKRMGKTELAPGKTSRHFLAGETALRRGSEQSDKYAGREGVGGFVSGSRRGSGNAPGGAGGSGWVQKAKEVPGDQSRRGSTFGGGWAG